MKCMLFILSQLVVFVATAQVTFTSDSSALFLNEVRGGVATAIADVDGDYFDDLISFDQGEFLVVNTYRGQRYQLEQYNYDLGKRAVWSVVAADVTGDGRCDIITASVFDVILYVQQDSMQFVASTIYENDWAPQGSNLADVDQDGDLDYFVCNDEGLNVLLTNDGNGVFAVSNMIDFATTITSDNSGNYSSVWTDLNGDGLSDLYLAKCRAGANELTDPRRINMLYINNGDGSYTERAAEFGLADGLQSWSVDAGDVDNDGDVDIFITNHDGPHKLMINQGDTTFVEYEDLPDNLSSFALQGVFYDMDNNGWLDIIITDRRFNNIVYNDNMNFTVGSYQPNIANSSKANTAIVGDVNNDGFADIWAQYPADGLTGSDEETDADEVLLNNGNENNFIKFRLVDELSTLVGTIISIETVDNTQMRTIYYGNSYGQQGSNIAHFGLGSATEIETVTITWPDGTQSAYSGIELEVNEMYVILKSGCLSKIETATAAFDGVLCPGGILQLNSAANNEVLWNTDVIPSTLTNIDTAGAYRYTYTDINGCAVISDYYNPISDSTAYEEIYLSDTFQTACQGDVVLLSTKSAVNYSWSNGGGSQTIEVTESGTYAAKVTSICEGEFSGDSLQVEFYELPLPPLVEGDSVQIGETALLISQSENTMWFASLGATDPIYVGDSLLVTNLQETTTYYAEVEQAYGTEPYQTYCTSERVEVAAVVKPVSVTDEEVIIGSIFPNPASDKLNIIAQRPITRVQLSTFLGEVIYSKSTTNGLSYLLDISDLSSGMYLLEVTDSTGKAEGQKIMVIK